MNYGRRFMTLYRRQGSRPSPWKRNAKKPNSCLKALQIAVKRREVKSKGEKERYMHLNAEFQRTARRDKKAFLRDQCKEIEENIQVRIQQRVAISFSRVSSQPKDRTHVSCIGRWILYCWATGEAPALSTH